MTSIMTNQGFNNRSQTKELKLAADLSNEDRLQICIGRLHKDAKSIDINELSYTKDTRHQYPYTPAKIHVEKGINGPVNGASFPGHAFPKTSFASTDDKYLSPGSPKSASSVTLCVQVVPLGTPLASLQFNPVPAELITIDLKLPYLSLMKSVHDFLISYSRDSAINRANLSEFEYSPDHQIAALKINWTDATRREWDATTTTNKGVSIETAITEKNQDSLLDLLMKRPGFMDILVVEIFRAEEGEYQATYLDGDKLVQEKDFVDY